MSDGGTVVSELQAKISATGADTAQQQLHKLGSTTDSLGGSFKGALGMVTGLIAGFTGFQLISDAIGAVTEHWSEWVKGAEDAQVAQAATNQILSSGAHVMGLTTEQVDALATHFMTLTGIDDDVVHGAENVLAGFSQISSKTFPDATQAALDMAASFAEVHGGQIDAVASSQALGRALQDPATGARLLRQYNIVLTQSQQESIKHFMAVNDVADAQAVVMQAVTDKVGGAADAYSHTAEGALMAFHTATDNIGKTLASIVLPIMTNFLNIVNPIALAFAGSLSPAVDGATAAINGFFQYIQPVVGVLESAWSDVQQLAGIFAGDFQQSIKGAGSGLAGFLPNMANLAQALSGVMYNLDQFARAAIPVVAGALGGALKGAIQGISDLIRGPFVQGFIQAAQGLASQFMPTLQGIGQWMSGPGGDAFKNLLSSLGGLGEAIITNLLPALMNIETHLQAVGLWLGSLVVPVVEALLPPLLGLVSLLAQGLTGALQQIGPLFDAFGQGVQGVQSNMAVFQPILNVLGQFLQTVVVPILQTLWQNLQTVGGVVATTAAGFATRLQPILTNVGTTFKQMLPPVEAFVAGLVTRLTPILQNISLFISQVLMPILTTLGNWLGPIIQQDLQMLGQVWGVFWPIFQGVLSAVWDTIKGIISTAWDLITGIINIGLDILGGNWKQAWKDIQTTFGNVWRDLQTEAKNVAGDLRKGITDAVKNLQTDLTQKWNDIKGDAITGFTNLKNSIINTVSSLPKSFYTMGTNLINELVNAIKDGTGALAQAIENLFRNAFKNLPGGLHVPGFAAGTNSAPGGTALVGEGKNAELVVGPTLMNLRQGSQVIPVSLSSGGGGGNGGTHQHFEAGSIVINGAQMTAEEIYDAWQEKTQWLARSRGNGG